ncbi:hypothetical protein MMIC_P0977 [Mariprofundus micogutta]|uniref:Uncharacterized protein n=1 Tax=Mariprofundus micogutta TaxID=1921010 RepID=A0A1L8CM87_9PROT|nr:hypothetical protein MMIC_P0977 [Mariprofundus micogutta]
MLAKFALHFTMQDYSVMQPIDLKRIFECYL